ncbi:putative leucine-rich repeat-containing protein DDB_G0290503 [Mytilus edulis]|uniref:putative leucine-rich repeat-containing protein DDB_G0290503 n=1 Tax=Mytilus edulis TaxID=6550 RepID=UPI0039EFD45E
MGKLETRDICWADSPEVITKDDPLKTIAVEIKTSEDKLNPLLYKITLFVRTGFIQAQGNHFEKFAKEDFPQLIHIMGTLTDETSQKQIITDTTPPTDANNNGIYTKLKTPISTKNQHTETEQVDTKITVTDEIQRLETSVTHKISQMLDNQNSNFQTLKTEIEQVKLIIKCTKTADELDTLLQASKNEVIILNERLNNKKEEINHLHISNQQLKDTLKESIEDLNTALQSSRNETHVLMDKLDKKDEEIEKFSTSNRSLSDKLDNLFEHNLNLKSQLLTLLDPQQAIQEKTQDIFTLQKADTSHLEQEYVPKVLLIGTSNTKGIKEDKVTNAVKIHKSIQYTIDEATTYITQYEEQPNLVILHILTNDLKNMNLQHVLTN